MTEPGGPLKDNSRLPARGAPRRLTLPGPPVPVLRRPGDDGSEANAGRFGEPGGSEVGRGAHQGGQGRGLGSEFGLLDAVGGERILFGSAFPDSTMSPQLYNLHLNGLDNDVLSAICAGNLERLLGIQRP